MKSRLVVCIVIMLLAVIPRFSAQQYRIDPAITQWLSQKDYAGTVRQYKQSDLDNVPATVMSALQNLGVSHFTILRNEMYARHGYIFKTPVLSAVYKKVSWYQPDAQAGLNSLTAAEARNVNWIKAIEDKYDYQVVISYLNDKGYTGDTALYSNNELSLPVSVELALNHLYINPAVFFRNEIFARNGYQFTSGPLRTIFAGATWYKPLTTNDKIIAQQLNNFERVNIGLLRERGWVEIVNAVKFSLPEGVISIPVIGFNSLFIKEVGALHFSWPDAWTAMEENGAGMDNHVTEAETLVDAAGSAKIIAEKDPRKKLILFFTHKKYRDYVDTIQFNASDMVMPSYLADAVASLGLDWKLLLRKEIHARNGARFIDPKVGPIFKACPWYRAKHNLNPRTLSRFPSGVRINRQELRNYSLLEGEELWGRLKEMNSLSPHSRKACDLLGNFYFIKIEEVFISGDRAFQLGHAFSSIEEYNGNDDLQTIIDNLIKSFKFNIEEYREQEQIEYAVGC